MNENAELTRAKVVKTSYYSIIFDCGAKLYSHHDTECREQHYLDFEQISLDDFEGLEFDLTNDNFFERIDGYGIALKPVNGHPVRIPGYASNNGYYSSDLSLILEIMNGEDRIYDITDCQDWE